MVRFQKIKSAYRGLLHSKYVKYYRAKCELLPLCLQKLKGFSHFQDPDEYSLVSEAEKLYQKSEFVTVLEITDGLTRIFYLIPGDFFSDDIEPEFELYFRVRSEEGLRALLGVIHRGKVGGKRFKHRSVLSFLASFVFSFLLSALAEKAGFWIQMAVLLALTGLIYLTLDYPFSLLYFRGVEVIGKPGRKDFMIIIKRRQRENRRKLS
ncbi:hypothetical protein [Thermococcus waiotapuensis]|uniref:Uncharacterized protein n=1 Tax=Thermococcus waiotapuensis TaxID=90909 RepID=A0AAE4NY15_9EURY|nr:hypothetical protein [Thermococcus waiotapuensis]MDV3104807.1 hypothetical protein [Thermococcus waiotapuensis]